MAVVSLLETTPVDQIYDLGEEINRPEFIFPKDSEFGIAGRYGDYALVQVKYAGRTGKEADGEYNGKVIKYKKWEDINYASTFWRAIKNYIDYKSLSLYKESKDLSIDDIKRIYLSIQETVCDALKSIVSYNGIKDVCSLYDTKQKLLEEINGLKKDICETKKVLADVNKLHNEIKEKHKIIVNGDKPKKHRIHKEED